MNKEKELLNKAIELIQIVPMMASIGNVPPDFGSELILEINELLAQPEQEPNQDIISDIDYLITALESSTDADDYWSEISDLRDDLVTLKGQGSVRQILEAFPLLDEEGLDQEKHHCEWVLQQDRKRLHAMLFNPLQLLAQPELSTDSLQLDKQEPAAWKDRAYGNLHHVDWGDSMPLYTSPPKREPMTGSEISHGFIADKDAINAESYWAGVRFAEKHYGVDKI